MVRNNKGFTLIELVLVIVILGILAVMALPQFVDLSTKAKQASRDGVVGAVRAAVNMEKAQDLVENGPPGNYPAALDAASDAAASNTNPIFGGVLQQGVTDTSWTKNGNNYGYDDGTVTCVYAYNSATGGFTGTPAADCP